jgi:hypothetical protein
MSDQECFKLLKDSLSLIESLELVVCVVDVSVACYNRDMRNAHRDVLHFVDGFVVEAERALCFEPLERKPVWSIGLEVDFVKFA